MVKGLQVKVPATSANLGSGFDAVAVALSLYNTVWLAPGGKPALDIEITGYGTDSIPTDERNLVYQAIAKLFKSRRERLPHLRLRQKNNIPPKSGLGSSAAAIAAGLVLGNRILQKPFETDELLNFGLELEGHADNVTAALLGGMAIACIENGSVIAKKVSLPRNLKAVVCVPAFEVETSASRNKLPQRVGLEDAVFNLSRAALLVLSFTERKFSSLKVAMEDRLHQDRRMASIPGAKEACAAAIQTGAYGAALSGSGPSVIALASGRYESVGRAMEAAFGRREIAARSLALNFDNRGARITAGA